MNDEERYLFDLQGSLVVRDVISKEHILALNTYLDTLDWEKRSGSKHVHVGMDQDYVRRGNSDPERGPVDLYAGLLYDWGLPFRQLINHQRLQPYLATLLGPDFRLDHQYAILMKKGERNATAHALHGGALPYDPESYYDFRAGRFIMNLLAVSFALTDATPETGGFCSIPGSHKSHYTIPDRFQQIEQPAPCVQQVPVKAGDVILFTEAIAHACLPWVGNYERRALMFKYCPGYVQWEQRDK